MKTDRSVVGFELEREFVFFFRYLINMLSFRGSLIVKLFNAFVLDGKRFMFLN